MSGRAIAVIAKPPVPGRVKTRLTPPLTAEQAARLSAAFLRDVLLSAASIPNAETFVVVPPDSDRATISALAPGRVSFLEEQGGDLGEIQHSTATQLFGAGFRSIVLIGSDLPTLSPAIINDAFQRLESSVSGILLGPSRDGGYYLIAMRGPDRGLFHGIDWGTENVLRQTITRARDANIEVELLSELGDIDTFSDLETLSHELGMHGAIAAPATRLEIERLRGLGVQLPDSATPWMILDHEIEVDTPWRSLIRDRVRTHSGDVLDWRYMKAPDPVVVVPVTHNGDIVLVRQYRQPIRGWSLEVPAGTGEGTLDEVVRAELREEIGAHDISSLEPLGSWYPMTGHASTLAHFYLALGVVPGAPDLERNELLVVESWPAETVFDMARRGEITDALCTMAVLLSESRIRKWLQDGASSEGTP